MATPLGEPGTDVDALIASYFARSLHTVTSEAPGAFETEELPLARIKRIMKQDSCDPFPRMISADAVPFMAFAVKLLIGVLTTLAWKTSTQRSKRNTLQLKDLKEAAASSSKFDFLIDTIDACNNATEHLTSAEAFSKQDSSGSKEGSFKSVASLSSHHSFTDSCDHQSMSLIRSTSDGLRLEDVDSKPSNGGEEPSQLAMGHQVTEDDKLVWPIATASATFDLSDLLALLDE